MLYNGYDEKTKPFLLPQPYKNCSLKAINMTTLPFLMRINALSRNFEEVFLSYNIPHRIYGGFKFYERVEIRNLIGYLRIFVNPKDDVSFARIINVPKRGIGDGTLAKLEEIGGEKSFVEPLSHQSLKRVLCLKNLKNLLHLIKK